MIPLSLSLTNFICYREAELDLSGLHVACLAGENGAGKSALLDAITWALWGRARARHDEELIHLGETEMAVDLRFELGADVYRVLRQRTAGKRNTTVLDFQILGDGQWRSIAESGIRQTQKKIEDVLRLDYDTFVNSAFLRQGRADEFTVKTAAERKRVLSDILGLDRWADYEERVKDQQRAVRDEVELTEIRLREIDMELAHQPEYEAELVSAQQDVVELSAVLQQAQDAYQALEAARAELRHTETQSVELRERLAQTARELERLAQEQRDHQSVLRESQTLLEQADVIEKGYDDYQQAVQREQALGDKLRQSVALDQRRTLLEGQIAEARREIETERGILLQRIADMEAQLADQALLDEYNEVQAQLTLLDQLAESREAARADLNAINQEQNELRMRNEALRLDMEALQDRIGRLERAGAECPLCGQTLTDEHRVQLLVACQADGQAKGDTFRANNARARALTERTRQLEEQIADSNRLTAKLPGLQRQEAALAERIARGQQAAGQVGEARQRLAAVEGRLAAQDYGHKSRTDLAEVLQEAAKLGYDVAAHEQARRDVAAGQAFAERRLRLGSARERILEEETVLKRLADEEHRWQVQEKQEHERIDLLAQQAAALREQLRGAASIEAKLQQVRGQEAAARQRLGASTQRLEACKALAQQRAGRLKRREELASEQSIYDELRTAFGVTGVPAMIIEAAVPEIEAEANQLLARMTGGRMNVRFETQRETLAGAVRETLEIKIADELGERPYENYSGGEQFRINFAIRVALSRLLARRAGAQLQTLVIDEGFGTQDAQGRERLVEAINAVQDDFARLLVITHIEELKDAFPARIEVTKTAEGSVLSLS